MIWRTGERYSNGDFEIVSQVFQYSAEESVLCIASHSGGDALCKRANRDALSCLGQYARRQHTRWHGTLTGSG